MLIGIVLILCTAGKGKSIVRINLTHRYSTLKLVLFISVQSIPRKHCQLPLTSRVWKLYSEWSWIHILSICWAILQKVIQQNSIKIGITVLNLCPKFRDGTGRTFSQAKAYCQAVGGILAILDNPLDYNAAIVVLSEHWLNFQNVDFFKNAFF